MNRIVRAVRHTTRRVVIRILDLLLAIVLTPLVIVLLAAVALVYRWNGHRGIWFTQIRVGKNRKPFTCHKIRTWDHNHIAPMQWWLPQLLLHSGLDEIPQIITNIYIGNMSFIGPRALSERDAAVEGDLRFEVQQGICGPFVLGLYTDEEFVSYHYGVATWIVMCAYAPWAIATGKKVKHIERKRDEQ